VTDAYTYDANGLIASYVAAFDGAVLYSETIDSRDGIGRITAKTDGYTGGESHVWTYTYDAPGRLTDVTEDGQPTGHYEYDLDDNRTLATTVAGGTVIGSYDPQDRLVAYGGTTYGYGANGELQTKTDASGTTEYTYDSFGNLRNVTPPTGRAIDYVIDGLNRRVGRKVGGTLVEGLLYQSQLNVVAELDGSGNLVAQYVYSTKPNVPDVKTDGAGTYRILSDHLGNPRIVVNTATGTVVGRMDLDEWGNVTADSAPGTTPFGFAGGLYDFSTGLTRFGARDYDAVIGRWTMKDPILFNGGQANIYEYTGDDAVNATDPNGKDASNSCPTGGIQCCVNGQSPANDNCIYCDCHDGACDAVNDDCYIDPDTRRCRSKQGRCPRSGGSCPVTNDAALCKCIRR
jgi:RHS repeat-associated protein